jgi:tRNA pseudouridine32 synthase/23S rRNA pseudouridine746 synthase
VLHASGSPSSAPTSPDPLTIVHVDAVLLVVDKPAGLLSVPGRGADKADCAAAWAQALYGDAQIVHRLDMATSGLLLMARGATMQRALSVAFQDREVVKRYEALVSGLVALDSGEIDLPLMADWPQRPRQKVDRLHGKPSLTRYRVLRRDPASGTTRLELQPITGRTHQLRVHLQAIGHPIVGDSLYATPDTASPSRLMLHAGTLQLRHPTTGEPLTLSSAVPF